MTTAPAQYRRTDMRMRRDMAIIGIALIVLGCVVLALAIAAPAAELATS